MGSPSTAPSAISCTAHRPAPTARRRRARAGRPPGRRRAVRARHVVRRHHRRAGSRVRLCRGVGARGDGHRSSGRHGRGGCAAAGRRRRQSSSCTSRPSARARPAPPVAADDRQRAAVPAAVHRPVRRAGDRRRAAGRAASGSATRSASTPSAPTRSCTTTSPSTARSTGNRCTTSPASTRSTTCCSRPGCDPASRSASCRATWPATRSKTVFAYRGHHLPAQGLGPLVRPRPRTRRAPARALRRRGARVGLRGVERGQPRGVLERHPRGVDAPLRRHREGGEGRRRAHPRRRAVVGRVGLGRRPARARPPSPAARSTSSRRTPTAARRWTFGRRWPASASRTRASSGPSGASRPTHFHPSTTARPRRRSCCRGMRSSSGRLDALSYWVASDHFEELGRPPRLLHGGFGLITVGGIAKPRYHALLAAGPARRHRAAGHRDRRRRRRTRADLGDPPRRRQPRRPRLVLDARPDQARRRSRPGPPHPAAADRHPGRDGPPSPGSTATTATSRPSRSSWASRSGRPTTSGTSCAPSTGSRPRTSTCPPTATPRSSSSTCRSRAPCSSRSRRVDAYLLALPGRSASISGVSQPAPGRSASDPQRRDVRAMSDQLTPTEPARGTETPSGAPRTIELRNRRICIDGEPGLVPRWRGALLPARRGRCGASGCSSSKDCGCNTLATYVPWLWHELADGTVDVTGRTHEQRDLAGFLDLAPRDGAVRRRASGAVHHGRDQERGRSVPRL